MNYFNEGANVLSKRGEVNKNRIYFDFYKKVD
jgi:hypothetical protein